MVTATQGEVSQLNQRTHGRDSTHVHPMEPVSSPSSIPYVENME